MMRARPLKRFTAVAFLLASMAAAPAAVCAGMKIGQVSSERLLRESAPARAAQARIQAEFAPRDKELVDDAARLKAASDKLDKDSPTLGDDERIRRQRELVTQDRELQRKRREFQDDLTQRKSEEVAGVVEQTNRVMKQIFDSGHYDLIVQDVPYFNPKLDITDQVIKALAASTPAR